VSEGRSGQGAGASDAARAAAQQRRSKRARGARAAAAGRRTSLPEATAGMMPAARTAWNAGSYAEDAQRAVFLPLSPSDRLMEQMP
jgi:hypothetical protein